MTAAQTAPRQTPARRSRGSGPVSRAAAPQPTSLKLPAGLKQQIDDLAAKRGQTAHGFMLQTLAEATERARLREQFVADAQEALHDMVENGREYDLADVREYFARRDKWRKGAGPKPRHPAPARSA